MEPLSPLSAALADLGKAVDDPGVDLDARLRSLSGALGQAVGSFLGLRLTLVVDGPPVILTMTPDAQHAEPAATSLLVPLAALGTARAGGSLVFFAAVPGAFVDLAADLVFALGIESAVLLLDDHLPATPIGLGVAGLRQHSVVNQAIGILMDLGHTAEAAIAELARRARLDGGDVEAAAALLCADVAAARRRHDGR